ncbi:MBL fold metallo-hydrolase [Candidatus Woesearchaeota archaeon]|nr:MBL fold metallo-hydrolase [Candidatus Woesearchaeota archaeon]
MIKLTPYGGANEIGGNKILLEDKDARIYLDFGESFDFGEDYFYEYLAPRTANGLEVYFEFGLLPKVSGLYAKELLKFTDLPYKKPDIDAVLISHSHTDHTSHLSFLDPSIPVYMGHGTKAIMDIYAFLYPGFQKYGEHEQLHTFKTGDKIKIKHLIIEPVHVEHSVPGAYGFIIHTSKGNLVYTGDLRLHGPKKEYTLEFIDKARKAKPFAMLCEGTRIGSEQEKNMAEEDVNKSMHEIIKNSKGIVFTYFSMSNVDRFWSVYKAAVENKRILVIDTKLAYILANLRSIVKLPDPLKDPNIMVYFRFSKSCEFQEKDYFKWEREFFSKKITFREIKAAQKKYVMVMNFFKLMELVYIRPENADFIYSMAEHFYEGDDNEEMRQVVENWMAHFKVKFHKAHCSGHASREDLIQMVKTINPQIIIPIHTQHPKEFEKFHSKVLMPENEKTLVL